MQNTKLLPLGSIVLLKDGEKKLMIYGRDQIATVTKEDFDYISCLWPEGNMSEEYIYLFNHEDIDSVYHLGYSDDEDLQFLNSLELKQSLN